MPGDLILPRPIVVIDTSVFVRHALSRTHMGAASQLLAILPVVAHIVTCDEIRDEIVEKLEEHAGWPRATTMAVYGPVFDAALSVAPVPEREDHRRIVYNDEDDTMLVRVAEAIYVELPALIAAGQLRYVVSENTRHLRPGSAYAGFLFGTAHDVLAVLKQA